MLTERQSWAIFDQIEKLKTLDTDDFEIGDEDNLQMVEEMIAIMFSADVGVELTFKNKAYTTQSASALAKAIVESFHAEEESILLYVSSTSASRGE